MGLFLSLVTMSGYTLIIALLLLTSDDVLSQEALLLWEQAVSRDVTLLPPQWFPTGGNTAADFLSRHDMTQWIFMLDRKVFRSILDHSGRKQTRLILFWGVVVEGMAHIE